MSPLESPRALTDDLPSFSLSPLPYITEVVSYLWCGQAHVPFTPPSPQIGDCLLTMPQQLEPFTSQDNPALSHALKHGRLPFLDGQGKALLNCVT